uniref:Protein kinase domain-containing protein n=1 Tax=Scophthalmus maximus TaxID=52904 RepID=A0A8D3A4L6_SCOMX
MYFIFDEDAEWRLRTSEEYEEVTGHRSKVSESFFHSARNLEDAVKRYLENQDDLEYEDRMAFSHLLKCCLNTNAEQRICPREALYHRFTTMNFQFHKLSCLVFEMLDRSLWNLMEEREWTELSLNEIRPVTQQLLVACEALNNIGIIYMDMKPDNIMFVNHKDQPFKIKLIDFGLALPVSQGEVGEAIENLAYVAPEVVLGLPLSEAVDMWGVGCIMAFMYFGIHLFPLDCPYDWMKTLVHLLGPPNYDQMTAVSESFLNWARNLKDAVKRYPKKQDDLEYEDRMAFLALYHRFTIMAHLVDKMETNYYTDMALKIMWGFVRVHSTA